jgi:hypothetical protein
MAEQSIKPGDDILFYWDDEAVAAQTDGSFSGDMNNRETSNKQTGRATTSIPTRYSGTVSITALFDENATLDPQTIFNDWIAGKVKPGKLSSEKDGDYAIEGDAYISSYSENYPDQDNIELSIDVTFTGDISKNKISTSG